jgi:hypothetical protein
MKILNVRWFCGTTNVGIVRVQTEYDGVKYYISAFEPSTEDADAEFIAAWGASFPKDAGDVLFGIEK